MIDLRTIVGITAGAILGVFVVDYRKRSPWRKIVEIAAGIICGFFFAEPLSVWISGSMEYAGVWGFLVGMFGMKLAEIVFGIDKQLVKDIASIMKRK